MEGRFEDNEQRGLDREHARFHRHLIRSIKRRTVAEAVDLDSQELESLLAELHVTTLALDDLFSSSAKETYGPDDTDERKVDILEFLREISTWHSAALKHAELGTQIFKSTHARLGLFRDGKLTQDQGIHLVRTLYTIIGNLQLLVYFNDLVEDMIQNDEQQVSQALRTRHAQQAVVIYSVYADQIKERLSQTTKLGRGDTLALGLFPTVQNQRVQIAQPQSNEIGATLESEFRSTRRRFWTGFKTF